MVRTKPRCCAGTVKLASRLYRANATSIVGSHTASDRLPAILMSQPEQQHDRRDQQLTVGRDGRGPLTAVLRRPARAA
jgi:hypothetical protein